MIGGIGAFLVSAFVGASPVKAADDFPDSMYGLYTRQEERRIAVALNPKPKKEKQAAGPPPPKVLFEDNRDILAHGVSLPAFVPTAAFSGVALVGAVGRSSKNPKE